MNPSTLRVPRGLRRTVRGPVLAGCLAAAAVLAGCGAASTAQTDLVTPNFTNARAGEVLLRAVVLVKSAQAPDAALVGGFVNEGATKDVLTEVRITPTADSGVPISTDAAEPGASAPIIVKSNLSLPPNELVEVGGPGNPRIRVPGLGEAPARQLGTFVTATLVFRDAGPVTVDLQVADPVNYFTDYAPTPAPNPATRVERPTPR